MPIIHMKYIYLSILFLFFKCLSCTLYCQTNNPIVKAWGIAQQVNGGAPESAAQTPIQRLSYRFFLQTILHSKVKIIAVRIGNTAYAVVVEHKNKNFPDRDYKPADFNNKKYDFMQVLITDSIGINSISIPVDLLKQNQAVIVYSAYGKKHHFFPVKKIAKERINLP